jgi:putative ABC transport system ATP-binding protein
VILAAEEAGRTYRPGTGRAVQALEGVSLELPEGQITLVRGPSGSGKTTLLCLLGTLLRPTTGRILVDGRDMATAGDAERTRVRRHRMGFVFQGFHLVPRLTAWQNVAVPLLPHVPSEEERRRRAMDLLAQFGLEERAGHTPEELSGGEQQRVAIARALVAGPEVLLADEPTASIDEASIRGLMQIFQRLRGEGMTVLIVSHDPRLLDPAEHVFELEEGRLRAS